MFLLPHRLTFQHTATALGLVDTLTYTAPPHPCYSLVAEPLPFTTRPRDCWTPHPTYAACHPLRFPRA